MKEISHGFLIFYKQQYQIRGISNYIINNNYTYYNYIIVYIIILFIFEIKIFDDM
jgi:hypothetical protein